MPYNLSRFELADMLRCGLELRRATRNASSVQDVAQAVVSHLYRECVDQAGDRACALVRFYRTLPFSSLDEDRQAFARRLGGSVARETRCLTLEATAGEREAWNDPSASRGHKAIPLPSAQVVERAPMIAQLIRSLGLDINTVLKPDPVLVRQLTGKTYNVFHVEHARGSPYIPAQEDFVIPYSIESVVGFGGLLPSGELFSVILFAKVPIARDAADRFRTVALDLKAILFGLREIAVSRS